MHRSAHKHDTRDTRYGTTRLELDGAIQWYLKHRLETQKNGAPRTTVSDEDISALRVIDAADSGDREAQLIFGHALQQGRQGDTAEYRDK